MLFKILWGRIHHNRCTHDTSWLPYWISELVANSLTHFNKSIQNQDDQHYINSITSKRNREDSRLIAKYHILMFVCQIGQLCTGIDEKAVTHMHLILQFQIKPRIRKRNWTLVAWKWYGQKDPPWNHMSRWSEINKEAIQIQTVLMVGMPFDWKSWS